MADTLTVVTLCLFLSYVFAELFFRLNYPRIIGQILAGMVLGLPLFQALFTPEILNDITFLAELGIIFLLLLTGLQLNVEKFKKSKKDALLIALSCVIVPFIIGFALMKAMGFDNLVAFVVGAVISLTAEGPKLKVLLDLRALNTKIGTVMLGAGILDDIFEAIFLSIMLIFANKSADSLIYLPLNFFLFVFIVYIVYKIFPKVFSVVRKEHSRIAHFSFILLFALFVAVVSTKLELGPILGAFIAGIIIHLSERNKYEHQENIKELRVMTFAFVIPFFFISIGLNFDFNSLTHNVWLTIIVIFVALVGKLMGALLVTPFTSLNLRQTHLIGWAMNSRGSIELVIATVAHEISLIPTEVFSALVVMSVVSTLIFPLVLNKIISADRTILKNNK